MSFQRHKTEIDAVMELYGINSAFEKAAFVAQCHVETNGFKTFVENLNYSEAGLLATFSRKRISADDAKRFGRSKTKPADQRSIANIIYGGEFGVKNLGNTQPGDGFAFIGRGAIQITGRHNYTQYAEFKGIDFVSNPALVLNYIFDVAGWFWTTNNIKRHCNITNENQIVTMVTRVTRIVNGGSNKLNDRINLTRQYYKIYG